MLNFSEVEQMMFDYPTYDLAIRNLRKSQKDAELLEIKERNKLQIEEILPLLSREELVIWQQRYVEGKDVSYIYDTNCWSKTSYFRIRKRLVLKFMKCLGSI